MKKRIILENKSQISNCFFFQKKVTIKKMNDMISFSPNSLSVSVISNVCFFMMLRAFEWILWWFVAMVCGSLIISSNPHELISLYVKWVKNGISYWSPFPTWSSANNLKQLILDFQDTSANEMTTLRNQLKIANDEIATLRSQMATLEMILAFQNTSANEMTTLRNQLATLEMVIRYQYIVNKGSYTVKKSYTVENHVPGEIMVKLWKIGCIFGGSSINIAEYLFAEGREEKNKWLTWTTHATEDELINFITGIYKSESITIFYFPIVNCYIYINPHGKEQYRKQMELLKENTKQWFSGCLPEKCGTFAELEAYFTRVENVLTKLHEMNLLK